MDNTTICICGKEISRYNTGHMRKCKQRVDYKNSMISKYRDYITEEYQRSYSISEIIRNITEDGITIINRRDIVKILKSDNIYEGMYGDNYLKNKVSVTKNTMMKRYGVENSGQLPNMGWSSINDIEYEKISYISDEYIAYRNEVEKITKRNARKIEKPKYCEYTGVAFVDEEYDRVNPNDPRKRTVDHKIPIIVCYLNELPAKEAAAIDNIHFVLRYVNSVKGNTLDESFRTIANKIRRIFTDAGFESN